MSIFNVTPGGSGAKTRVVNVSDASALPATAREGTIAVVSSTRVKTVYVQEEQPETAAPGDLWIAQGSGKLLYSVGKTVNVSFTHVKQFDGQEWENVLVYQYVNGEWVNGLVYLLYFDDDCTDLTGGWLCFGTHSGKSEKIANGYQLTQSNGGNQRGSIQTENKIDLKGIKSIHCKGTITAAAQPVKLGIQSKKLPVNTPTGGGYDDEYTWYYGTDKTKYAEAQAVVGDFEIVYDVSLYSSGSYFVGVGSGSNAVITEIWAEYN